MPSSQQAFLFLGTSLEMLLDLIHHGLSCVRTSRILCLIKMWNSREQQWFLYISQWSPSNLEAPVELLKNVNP